jgi:hypothetical protein
MPTPSLRPGGARRRGISVCAAAPLAAAVTIAPAALGQLRIVNYNVASLEGNLANLQGVFAALNEDDRPGFAVAPHVYVFQEVKLGEQTALLAMINAEAPPGVSYALATYTNDDEDGAGGAQALAYRADALAEDALAHADVSSGAGRDADRWRLELAGYDNPEAAFYVYGAHLKASSGEANESERYAGVVAIRSDADALPAGAHVLYCGDMNFYHNEEAGYLEYLSAGPGQAVDPLGSGAWSGSGNAIKHSQSPLLTSDGSPLVGGGMDDRFDFQLPTLEWFDGMGLAIMAGTYRALGNDGQHYNESINAGNNFYYPGDVFRSNALADLLHGASDHLPIVVEYVMPALVDADLPADFGRAIRDSLHTVTLSVANGADAVTAAGADVLSYSATGAGALLGFGSGALAALAPPAQHAFVVDTTLVGARTGIVVVHGEGQGVGNNDVALASSGVIVRPSDPSFSGASSVTEVTLTWESAADQGVLPQAQLVHNRGWTSVQATLDVDAVEDPGPPFAFTGSLVQGIAGAPAPLSFTLDTTGLAAGTYESVVVVLTSDEDIPGETVRTLEVTLHATIEGDAPGDVDGDGDVDFNDLLALLSAWGPCPPPPAECPADFDGSGVVDFLDLLAVLSSWT